jgi:hypothetical protein
MSGKPKNRIVRAVTDLLWERDRLQMQAMGALMSAMDRKRRRRGGTSVGTRATRTKRSSR